MFSVLVFTCIAISAIASTGSGANRRVTCSVFRSSTYCVIRAFRGSVRMRTKSSRVKGSSSTRIGKRPWSSGIRSDGLAMWNAPAAMNRMWSVRTTPYLVVTDEPSTIGRRSRWSPSQLTSGPWPPSRPATLSRQSRTQRVEQPLFRELLRSLLHAGCHLRLDHVDGELGQVPDHRLHVAADVADLRVLRGFDLQERSLRELCQAPGDLGLSDAGGADHDDVLRRDLVPQLERKVLPPPAVAEGDGDRTLCLLLADDVAVELGDDLSWSQREVCCSGVHEAGSHRGRPERGTTRLRTPGLAEGAT